jgi:hypothetical protein
VKFDTLAQPDGSDDCAGGSNEVEFSYIWIANTSEGTLSKIDTEALVEVGRYIVRDDALGSPSRTSVNLAGDVAVANRSGGITKVHADTDDCVDTNGTPGIQTSTGPNDVLAWGEEECIAWYTPMNYTSQRPIAWAHGTYNEDTCAWENPKVWTTGTTTPGVADVFLLNGADGSIEEQLNIPNLEAFNSFGGYGAVVDSDSNLWFNEMFIFGDQLVRVNAEEMTYDLFPTSGRSGYGIAIDNQGRIWTCGDGAVNRFDPADQSWSSAPVPSLSFGGCMVDGEDRLWVSSNNNAPFGILSFDTDSVSQLASFPLTEHVHGISIDFSGYVWGVGGEAAVGNGERAFRIDPDDGTYDTVEGLVGAYTYSDMTGFALASAIPG